MHGDHDADAITYHPNGQVNTVRHLNDPANSAPWVTDTWYDGPLNPLLERRLLRRCGQGLRSLNPSKVKSIDGGGRVGSLSDGRTVVVRPTSTSGDVTLEIQDGKNQDTL